LLRSEADIRGSGRFASRFLKGIGRIPADRQKSRAIDDLTPHS
jgi:hypothetical protein